MSDLQIELKIVKETCTPQELPEEGKERQDRCFDCFAPKVRFMLIPLLAHYTMKSNVVMSLIS